MMRPGRTAACLLLAVLSGLLSAPTPAWATKHECTSYTFEHEIHDGHEVRWPLDSPYLYHIKTSSIPSSLNVARVQRRVKDGARMWNDMVSYCPQSQFTGPPAYSGYVFGPGNGPVELNAGSAGDSTVSAGQKDGINTIDFGPDFPSSQFHFCANPKTIACTEVHWKRGNDNLIEEADIRFKSTEPWSDLFKKPPASQFDLWSLAAHEFGHVIGLSHFKANDQVMTQSIKEGQTRRFLRSADLMALCSTVPNQNSCDGTY